MLKRQNVKFSILFAVFLLALAILVTNVFVVSVTGYHVYTKTNIKPQAESIHVATEELSSRRGKILDHNGAIIAQDTQTYDLIAIIGQRFNSDQTPAYVIDKEETARLVAPIIGIDQDTMLAMLNQEGLYQVQFGNHSRHLSLTQKQEIEALALPGLVFYDSFDRSYPLGLFSSNLIGFARYDQDSFISKGIMGLEQAYNQELVGTNGTRIFQQTSNGYIIDDTTIKETSAINGQDIYLTLDQSIQELAEVAIATTKEKLGVTNLFLVAMEVETGKVVAMAQDPKFNPNDAEINYSDYNLDSQFEPGSTFKAFTYAAAIDSGHYDGDALFDSSFYYIGIDEKGEFYRSQTPTAYGRIQNAQQIDRGQITFDEGFKWSSNVGTTTLLEQMGVDTFKEYLEAFKFTTPIETNRLITSSGSMVYQYPIEQINTTFGQGITINPLQMVQAYSAILNEGVMVKPYFVDKIVDTTTNTITYQGQTEIVGHPIEASTAQQVLDLMRQCVVDEDGFCHIYDIEESKVFAKTGTAQMVIDGEYDKTEHIHSIVLGLPYDDPQILVYFGYQGDFEVVYEDQKDGIKSLMKSISLKYDTFKQDVQVNQNDLRISRVPQLINHSIEYAQKAVVNTGFEVIKIGDGSQVINQLPLSNQEILSNQRLFVVTSLDGWLMPDMTDWALKDITNFWSLTGIEVTTIGSGRVVSQSLPVGSEINSETKLTIQFK